MKQFNKSRERERERERENNLVWLANNRDKPPIPEPPRRIDDNQGGDDNSNNPKCSKCGVNYAVHSGLVLVNKNTGKKQTVYDQPLCSPCAEELSKCSKCKANPSKYIKVKKDGSMIIYCGECKCSKCKVNKSIAEFVEVEGVKFYQGLICETCIRELIKCEICKVNSAVLPDGNIRENQQKTKVCEQCYKQNETQQQKNEIKNCGKCNKRAINKDDVYYHTILQINNYRTEDLCQNCWEKNEQQHRRIAGRGGGHVARMTKGQGTRKEIFYNW